jgi:segregation and condensation protein B
LDFEKLKNALESLLFVAGTPLKLAELTKLLEAEEAEILRALGELEQIYQPRGINLIKLAHGYQLVTNPGNAQFVSKLLDAPLEAYLTAPSLEVLAIIAYRQPVTRLQIDQIRGVASDSSIDTLLRRRLIEEVGRGPGLGRPILYGTTEEFLKHFGLKDLSALPSLPENETLDEALAKGEVQLPKELVNDEQDRRDTV